MSEADIPTVVVTTENPVPLSILDEIKKKRIDLGDRKFVSDSRLDNHDDDPGASNLHARDTMAVEDATVRRRTTSQPYMLPTTSTALTARINRRRPARSVAYADPPHIQYMEGRPYSINGEDRMSQQSSQRQSNESGNDSPYTARKQLAPQGYANGAYNSNSDLRSLSNRGRMKNRSVGDTISIKSMESPLASSSDEKHRKFRHVLSLTSSLTYAIFIFVLGVIIFLWDLFYTGIDLSSIYCLFLIGVGFLYIVYLLIDIRIYISKVKQYQKLKDKQKEAYENHLNQEYPGVFDGQYPKNNISAFELPVRPMHNYCFDTGRHADNFYLKLGAAAFGLGHLVHQTLQVAIGAVYLEGDQPCIHMTEFILGILYPVYSFFQLFFIFKYSNLIILKYKGLAQFAFMHMISSSLCLWFWTIVRETVGALVIYAYSSNYDNEDSYEDDDISNYSASRLLNSSGLLDNHCVGNTNMDILFIDYSPYLYPFTIEYSILIVSIFYVLWHNVGTCRKESEDDNTSIANSDSESVTSTDSAHYTKKTVHESNAFTGNMVIYANCHAASSGLFGGLVVILCTIISIIVAFIFQNTDVSISKMVDDISSMALSAVMLVAVVIAYYQIRKLDVSPHQISLLDDILLMVCLPAYFLEVILSLVATISILNVYKIIRFIVMFLQVVIQTPFIMDGMRRCSNSKKNRRLKPGKGIVTFLLICNVAMWILVTFSLKNSDAGDERYDFYGKDIWTVLGHISLPLMMFYRFHSSVCLADIWKHAYEPSEEHH